MVYHKSLVEHRIVHHLLCTFAFDHSRGRERERQPDSQADRKAGRQADSERETGAGRQADSQADTQFG